MPDSLTRPLLILTFVTGIVDAVCFIALGQAFAAMQTGNVIFLGLGLADAGGLDFFAPAVSLASFLLGGLGAALWLGRAAGSRPSLRTAIAFEAAALALAGLILAAAQPEPESFAASIALTLVALAMGLRNTLIRALGDPDLATTVLNLTLTSVDPGAQVGFASDASLGRRALALVAIIAGAITGALLAKSDPGFALSLAAVAAVVALLATPGSRR